MNNVECLMFNVEWKMLNGKWRIKMENGKCTNCDALFL